MTTAQPLHPGIFNHLVEFAAGAAGATSCDGLGAIFKGSALMDPPAFWVSPCLTLHRREAALRTKADKGPAARLYEPNAWPNAPCGVLLPPEQRTFQADAPHWEGADGNPPNGGAIKRCEICACHPCTRITRAAKPPLQSAPAVYTEPYGAVS